MDVKSGYDILRPDYLGHTQSQSQSQSPPLTRPPNRRDPGTSIRSDHASLSDPTAPGPRYGTSTQTGTVRCSAWIPLFHTYSLMLGALRICTTFSTSPAVSYNMRSRIHPNPCQHASHDSRYFFPPSPLPPPHSTTIRLSRIRNKVSNTVRHPQNATNPALNNPSIAQPRHQPALTQSKKQRRRHAR
ncbi:hypothetical protein ONS95_014259 [Cadophora gregata]|uniref:uncharacterized protein n=1 Tax=Cadophora gregata TaxID=51156 RepID=UPI0026DC5C1B|nr:uncharacterized protein ONS95_014259 [Cadophora gregata]KAK0114776.1 hypothetical protein ONS95_014259 [Cadophora gregata]